MTVNDGKRSDASYHLQFSPLHERLAYSVMLKASDKLKDIALSDCHWEVRRNAAQNPGLMDEEILFHISKNDGNPKVRRAAIRNPNFQNRQWLAVLADDPSDSKMLAEIEKKLFGEA